MTIFTYSISITARLDEHYASCSCDTDCVVTAIHRVEEWTMRIESSCGVWSYLPYCENTSSIGEKL